MSFLRDFGAGLFTGIGNQLQQREDEERRMQIEEALAKRRLAWQTQMENKINPRQPEPYGVPVQRGPGNWAQPTQQYVPPEFDPETYDITKPASYVPGPDMPAQDPTALSPKDAAMQDYRERQLAQQKELSEARTAALGRRSAGARTSEPKIREFGDRPWQLNEETGEWEPMAGPPPKSETAGGDSGKEYRAALERERTRAATYVNKQLEPYAKMDEAKALEDIYKRTGIRAPSLSAYRENQIQAAMAPWLESNPAPAAGKAAASAKGIPAPAGAKPGDQVRQKSTGKLFRVQDDGTMVEV
jgi:hypothetical protein